MVQTARKPSLNPFKMQNFRFAILLLAALLSSLPLPAGRPRRNAKMQSVGMQYLQSHFHLYDSLQHRIFEYAETGYNEVRSAEALCLHLEANGFRIERGVAGIPTAFVATFGSGNPVIGLMAEYDALKGMSQDTVPFRKPLVEGGSGHGCGHNLLGTGSVAGAVAVSKWLAQGHPGTVKLFGCPAEEGGGGKAYMVREGCFDGLDAMLDWHPDTRNTVNTDTGLANVQVKFTFHGTASHASGAPDKGRSALDAVEAFDFMINLMREHIPSTSRIHYVITDGGKAPNIVPDKASVLYYFRSPKRAIVGDLLDRALKAAEGAALGTGTTFDHERISGNYERLPNTALSDLLYANLRKVGGVQYDARETAFAAEMMRNSGQPDTSVFACVRTVVPPSEEGMSAWVSSDVGNVTWVVPTGSFRIAAFVPCSNGHSWQQTASAGCTIGTKGLLNAARVLYLTAWDLLQNPALLQKIQAEFRERRGPDFSFDPLMGDREPPFDYAR